MNNKGLFCESDGYIYYSNIYDNNYLYRMETNGTNSELVADIPVSYINAAGDYLYFYFDDPGGTKFMGIAGRMSGILSWMNFISSAGSLVKITKYGRPSTIR